MSFENSHLIGDTVRRFNVAGQEYTIDNIWSGSDVHFVLGKTPGLYLARVVTRDAFEVEIALEGQQARYGTNILLSDEVEQRPSFVVNDRVLSDEALAYHFNAREVGADLASSLFLIRKD